MSHLYSLFSVIVSLFILGCVPVGQRSAVRNVTTSDAGFCTAGNARFAFKSGAPSVPTASGTPVANCEDVCITVSSSSTGMGIVFRGRHLCTCRQSLNDLASLCRCSNTQTIVRPGETLCHYPCHSPVKSLSTPTSR